MHNTPLSNFYKIYCNEQCAWICDVDAATNTFKCLEGGDDGDYCNGDPKCDDGTDEKWCDLVCFTRYV